MNHTCRKLILTLLFMISVLYLSGSLVSAHHVPEEDYWNMDVNPLPANVEHHTFQSGFLNPDNNTVGLNVYTPPGYEDAGNNTRYPVIYLLHGALGHEANYFSWYNSFAALYSQQSILSLIEGTLTPPPVLAMPQAIVVFVNGGALSGYHDWTGPEHGPGSPFPIMSESIIIHEVIPYVDAHFRTIAHRSGRALEGFSMGGYGAIKLGLKYPELFCATISYGGGNYEPSDFPDDRLSNIVASNIDDILNYAIRVRLVRGANDGTPDDSPALSALLTSNGIDHEYEPALPNTNHDWGAYYRNGGDVGLNFHHQCFVDNVLVLDNFVYVPLVSNE
jgi:enterochelin esterase-like enzyme